MKLSPQQFYVSSWALTESFFFLLLFFFCVVSFVCLASFGSPPSSSGHSSPATIQACLPFRGVEDVLKCNFQIPAQIIWCLWRTFLFIYFFLFKEMIPCLSFLSPLRFSPQHDVALMVAVAKYRVDEWLMRPWPARQKISFSLAQWELTHRQTKGKKPAERISKCLSDQLMPESILGKPRLDKHSGHDTPAADWSFICINRRQESSQLLEPANFQGFMAFILCWNSKQKSVIILPSNNNYWYSDL